MLHPLQPASFQSLTFNEAGPTPDQDFQESVSSRVAALWQTRRKLTAIIQGMNLPNTYATWQRIKLVSDPQTNRQRYVFDYGKAGELLLLQA